MRVLICGVGKVTRHLLKRLGESWVVTLIDKSEERLTNLIAADYKADRVKAGDASSPVVLDEVGLIHFDYVLALTDNDKVNLAVCRYAKEQGVVHILALVNEQENQGEFEDIGVRTLLGSTLIARRIYHYLQDPRINVTPLTLGPSEVLEIDVAHHFRMVGREASVLHHPDWRLVAIFRKKELFFPEPQSVIEADDRLVIVGRPDIFKPVCDLLECGRPHFPLAYGQGLLLVLAPGGDHAGLIKESMHLAQNTKVQHLIALRSKELSGVEEELNSWSKSIEIRVEEVEGDVLRHIQEITARENGGVVVVHPFEVSFFKSLAKPTLVFLAHSLSCPLLVSRQTHPYQRILVPFNGSSKAELGLEVAVDLARQFDAEVAVVVVEEPDFITGDQTGTGGIESVLERAREIFHIHKAPFREIVRKGNPVKEIVEVSKDFDLMVMGSMTKEKALFSPHVGELLAREAPCSVLIVAS